MYQEKVPLGHHKRYYFYLKYKSQCELLGNDRKVRGELVIHNIRNFVMI